MNAAPAQPDLTTWKLKMFDLANDLLTKATKNGGSRLLAGTKPQALVDSLSADLLKACETQNSRVLPLPELSQSDLCEEIHNIAMAAVGQLEETLPAIREETLSAEPISPGGSAKLTLLSEIYPQTVHWAWPGRVPLGKMTVVAGDPGLGKSFLTLDMAARVTTKRQWPDGAEACDGSVILMNAEDDAADTIRPRLDALAADVSRIHMLEGVRDRSGERGFNLADTAQLEAEIAKIGNVRLVVIDPVSAFLGGTDSHKNSDVRALLAPLAKVAATTGVAIVCVTHLSKSAADPLNRLSGSIAFGAAARAVWLVSRDPERHERRLMLALKNNLATELDGLAFSIQTNEQGAPVVFWEHDPVTITAAEHLRELRDQAEKARHEMPIEETCDLLRSMLRDGPQPVAKVREEATNRVISERTVARARKLLGIESHRDGFGKDGGWVLELPTKGCQAPESPSTSGVAAFEQSPSLPMGSSKDANSNVTRGNTPDVERI